MKSSLATNLTNLALYQLGWFSCVLGAAWERPVTGAFLALMLFAVHLFLARFRRPEILLALAACLIGTAVDTLQQSMGVFTFNRAPEWPLWLPPWVFVIWAQFATLFHFALRWLSGRYLIAAVFGSVGGPLAYWAGIRLGAAAWGEVPVVSIISLACVWALVTPTLVWLSDRTIGEEQAYRWFSEK